MYICHMAQQLYSWGYTQRSVTQVTSEAPYTHFYCSTIHNSQVMETAKMPHLQIKGIRKCVTYILK
jgi:hypothetical protein